MKQLSILFTVILSSYSSIAQDYKFELGVQAGPNLTNLRYASSTKSNPKVAYTAGLFFQYNISNTFSLRTDPAYERLSIASGNKRFTDQRGKVLGTWHSYSHYDYVTLPILVKAGIGNKIRYFINAGPCLGFLLNQKSIMHSPYETSTTNNTDRYKSFNFGIVGGIGIALPIKEKFSLSLELRNNLGLSNINSSKKSNSSIKTNVTSLLLGFSFIPGKCKPKGTFIPTF